MARVLQTVMVTRWTPALCPFLFSSSFYWKEVPVLGSPILDWWSVPQEASWYAVSVRIAWL